MVAVMGMVDHGPAHARWELQGRPASFQESLDVGDLPPAPEGAAMPLEVYQMLVSLMGEEQALALCEQNSIRVEGP